MSWILRRSAKYSVLSVCTNQDKTQKIFSITLRYHPRDHTHYFNKLQGKQTDRYSMLNLKVKISSRCCYIYIYSFITKYINEAMLVQLMPTLNCILMWCYISRCICCGNKTKPTWKCSDNKLCEHGRKIRGQISSCSREEASVYVHLSVCLAVCMKLLMCLWWNLCMGRQWPFNVAYVYIQHSSPCQS